MKYHFLDPSYETTKCQLKEISVGYLLSFVLPVPFPDLTVKTEIPSQDLTPRIIFGMEKVIFSYFKSVLKWLSLFPIPRLAPCPIRVGLS